MEEVIDILLVDDEPKNLDALEAILSDSGYRLLRAGAADEALRLLLHHNVAAIVMDVKMPGLSGFELAQLIKGSKRTRQIPILFLTAYLIDDHAALEGYGAGAVDYLTKPLNPQILRRKVAVFADLFRKTRALAELNEQLEERVQERTAELEARQRELKEADRQKDQFIATLAHELRNPLAPLRTGLDVLQRMGAQPPAVERTMLIMNRQLDHMVRLIDDLLDVSRISRGMLELKKSSAHLNAVLETAIDTCKPLLDQRRQSIAFRAEHEISALVDSTRVCQIVGNLIHNAAKFSPEGSLLRLELVREDDSAIVRVIDSGAGIEPEQLDAVFEMFGMRDRRTGGLGIGLALARNLAELHGGSLSAESRGKGLGSTFTLRVPIGQAVAEPKTNGVPRSPVISAGPLRVLVIEDNVDAAETLTMWLRNMGHEVLVAHTGEDGLDLLHRSPPQVVLCDVGLPSMDGLEVCRRVRTASLDAAPVMVALTGWGMDEDRQRTRDAGFDHHLVKPVALDRLREILGQISAPS